MEMSYETKKSKKKFPIGLLVCLAVLIVCTGVTTGILVLRNVSSNKQIELSEQMEAADEDTLRMLLSAEGSCTITLTDDVVVSEELDVYGTKIITGDNSIVMDTVNIGSGESVCSVSDGAKLVLDGATIDGNGVVNGVSVKVGGEFAGLSGNIVYGYPYGITIAGTAELNNITIYRTMHTAIYAEYGGEVHMTGGTLSNNVYGVSVASGAYMSISGTPVFTKSNATVVTNYGKMEIKGGTYTSCFDNVITNQGEMSIIGTTDKKIELADSRRSAIVSKKNSKLTVENCYMHNLGLHAIAIEKGSNGVISNSIIEKTGKSSFYANSSTFTMNNVEVSDGESYGLSAVKNSKIEMENVLIKDMKSRGVGIDESQLKAKNLEVKDTKSTGLYVVGEKAVVEVEDLTLIKNGASSLGIKSGKVTAKKVTIEEPKNEGVYVGEEAKLNIEDANINKTGMHSFMNYGTATAKNVKITNSAKIGMKSSDGSTITATNVVIKNAASHAVSVEKDSVANLTKFDIDHAGKEGKKAAVYVSKSKLNMKQSTIHDVATYAIAAKDCKKADGKVVNLDDVQISKTEGHGIGNVGSYVVAGNVKVSETKRAGIYTEGKDSITNMNQIEVVNAGTCGFGFKAGEITARNVTITTPTNEGVYVMKDANVKKLDNVVITDPGTQGVNVAGGTINITVDKKYNPDNKNENGITIKNPKLTGIKCIEGTVKAQGVTIKNAKNHAFDIENGSAVTVNGCDIDKTGKAAVYVLESKMTMKNAKIDNAASYGIGVRNSKKSDGRVVNLDNIEIINAGERGIGNFDSYVVAGNIKISNPKGAGIYTEGTASITNMNQIEITNAGTCGFGFKAGEITARNVTIASPTDEGIVVQKDANVKKLDNVTIKNPGAHGIANFGGIVNVSVDKKYNPDNTNGNGITITNPGKHGIYHEKETNGTTTLAHAKIINAGEYGIWNRAGVVTGSNVTINKTVKAGIAISHGATVELDNANISRAGEQGVLCDGVLAITNSINSENGLTITESKKHGIYISSTGNVESVGLNIVEAGGRGILSEGGSVNASNMALKDIKNQGLEIKGGKAVIANFNIEKTGSAAIKASNASEVILTDGTIQAYTYAIATEGKEENISKLTATDLKIVRAVKENKNQLVSVGAYSEFVLNETAEQKTLIDGNYSVATTEYSGMGVDVIGTFIMNGGTICHNYSESGAGVNVQEGATFTMAGGTVKENVATKYGAGVYVKGAFNMNAGTISSHGSKNTPLAVEGTGVCLSGDSAVFTMNGGKISNNYSSKAGAGLAMRDGKTTFIMNGGKITANHTTGNVGGVLVRTGSFTMNEGAVISNNKADKLAGGMSLEGGNVTTFIMNGGSFINNNSGTGGDDIYLSGKITLSKALKENIKIKSGNYTEDRVMVVKGDNITNADFQASIQYINMENGTDGPWVLMCKNSDNAIQAVLKKAYASLLSNGQIYTSLDEAVQAAVEGDTITVLRDAKITNTIKKSLTVTSDKAITITADGNLKAAMFSVGSGKTLNIIGPASDKKISINAGETGDNVFQNNGIANLTNVNITGGKRGIYVAAGTVNLTSVQILNCTNEGLCVEPGASVEATGITVKNTGMQGLYFKGESATKKATATISNFSVSGTGSAAVRLMTYCDVTLINGTVTADSVECIATGKNNTLDISNLTAYASQSRINDKKVLYVNDKYVDNSYFGNDVTVLVKKN